MITQKDDLAKQITALTPMGDSQEVDSVNLPAVIDGIWGNVETLVEKWKADKPDGVMGFTSFIFDSTAELMGLFDDVTAFIGVEDRKILVADTVRYIYGKVDPDLPWIPEPFESKLEAYIMDNIWPAVVNVLFARFAKK